MHTRLLSFCMLAMTTLGCQMSVSRDYRVVVKNNSTRPIIVWLTKDGQNSEPAWSSPEQIAIESPGVGEPIAGKVVPPGKTADTGKISGKFQSDETAVLRIYLGQLDFNHILAASRGDPVRNDLPLDPGFNGIMVLDTGGGGLSFRRTYNPADMEK